MRKAPYRPERIVIDSIERSVGYGAICEEMSSLSLLLRSFSRLGPVPSTCLPSLLVPFIPYCNCKSSVDYLAKHPSSKYSTGILLVENG
ncbi:hypothetical protein CR513_00687, partial [Mucuna pruriens]